MVLTAGATLGIWNIASLSTTEDYFVFEAPYGEKSKMTLADGTVVWLNAGSILKYSDKFNERNRKVILSGEAYFEVTKKEKAEFTVQTCGYDVVVKGTKFDVSAYPEDSVVTTALIEGVVEIHRGEQRMEMIPGEFVKLDMATGKITRTRNDVKQWYTETGIALLSVLIDELNVQGHKRLVIHENGDVLVTVEGKEQTVDTIPDFPPRPAWDDLCVLAREDDISAEVRGQELAVSWP